MYSPFGPVTRLILMDLTRPIFQLSNSVLQVRRIGFEPMFAGLKTRGPGPLDEHRKSSPDRTRTDSIGPQKPACYQLHHRAVGKLGIEPRRCAMTAGLQPAPRP